MATVGWPSWPPIAEIGTPQSAETPASGAPWGAPPPPADVVQPKERAKTGTGKRLRLERSSQVRAEMVRVYRELRAGQIEPGMATKLIYALTELSRLIEREAVETLEGRLEAAERARGR